MQTTRLATMTAGMLGAAAGTLADAARGAWAPWPPASWPRVASDVTGSGGAGGPMAPPEAAVGLHERLPDRHFEIIAPPSGALPDYPTVRLPITIGWPAPATPELIVRPPRHGVVVDSGFRDPLAAAFEPMVCEGLVAQITGVQASVSLEQTQQWQGGARVQRSLQVAGTVTDLSGSRAFRIVGTPRVLELTDQDGESLLADGEWQSYPDVSSPQPFTRPAESGGGSLQQSFSISGHSLGALPSRIGTLRVEMDVATAVTPAAFQLKVEATEEFRDLAPGIRARVAAVRDHGDAVSVSIEYRMDGVSPAGARAWFARAEILDDEGRVLQVIESAQEVHAKGCVIGVVQGWGIDTRRVPVWTVRLHFVTADQTHRIVLEERDLPLMGG